MIPTRALRARTLGYLCTHSTTMNTIHSSDHGPCHWERVWKNGRYLGAQLPACDLEVVWFFALFHDAMRLNEFDDPEHGRRGWFLAERLPVADLLSQQQCQLLKVACIQHPQPIISDDPTIGLCWDADRLDLPRVGIQPDPRYLSTDVAKTYLWAAIEI